MLTAETQPDPQSEQHFESRIELLPEESSEIFESLDLESLYPETLKIITPSTPSVPSTDPPHSTLVPPTSPTPATETPTVVNKPVFKRITTPFPSSLAPSHQDPTQDTSFKASPLESDVFGAKFFQPEAVKHSSDKTALDKSVFDKFKPSTFKPASFKPIFVSKNASLKTTTYWPATENPETSQLETSQPEISQPAVPQSNPTQPAIPQFAPLQPATSQPAPPQPSLPQPDAPQSTLPDPSSPQPTPPQPSSTHLALPNSSPLHVQPHFAHHQPSPPQPSPPSSSPLHVQPHFAHHQSSPHPTLPNSSPFIVQPHPTYPQPPPQSSPLLAQPHPSQPHLPNPSTPHSNAQKTPSSQSSTGGRQEDSISSNLVLSGFGKVKPVQHLHPSPVQPQPIFQSLQPINTQPNSDSDNALGFVVSLGPLTLLTSPSKTSPTLVSVHGSSPSISGVQEKKGRSIDAPSLSPASSKKHFSRSHSFEHLHPVFKTQPRHLSEEGDESRSISFSVNPPNVASKLTSSIATKSRGTPTTITFNVPRPAAERQEAKKHQDKEENGQKEVGRSIPHPNSAPLRFGQPRVTTDARSARRVHNAAPPHPIAPQEKAVPAPLPHGPYHAKHPAQYEFSYQVQGGDGGSPFGHTESRAGPETRGSYTVPLPDGRIQRVTYYVSGDSGYMADVTYEGQAVYPQYKPAAYRTHPTHHGPAPANPAPPRQPTRAYRSEPVQPIPAHKSEPIQPAVPQQYASESHLQPVQFVESPRTYRSVPQRATSYVSSSMYKIDLPYKPASWPAV
ncbi:hypothetical protein O3P69_014767 [Scylla paramamosain]|uniref:Uncharacterized protein n=1 Tax=Scylla paramamosain TaxID=85552 RepID=A0AAW0TZU9_SCYPA